MSKNTSADNRYAHLTVENFLPTIFREMGGVSSYNKNKWYQLLSPQEKLRVLELVSIKLSKRECKVEDLVTLIDERAISLYHELQKQINSIQNQETKTKLINATKRKLLKISANWSSAVDLAMEAEDLNTIKALFNLCPGDTYYASKTTKTILNKQINNNETSFIEFLTNSGQIQISTFLAQAITGRYNNLAKYLISMLQVKELSATPELYANTYLGLALRGNNDEIAKILIEKMSPEQLARENPYSILTNKSISLEIKQKLIENINTDLFIPIIRGKNILQLTLDNALEMYENNDSSKAIAKILVKRLTSKTYNITFGDRSLIDRIIQNNQYELIAEMLTNAEDNNEKKVSRLLIALYKGVENGEITTDKVKEYAAKIPDKILNHPKYLNLLIAGKPEKAAELIQTLTQSQLIKQDAQGNTALHYAVIHNKPELVTKLLDKLSPDHANSQNKKQESPRMIAIKNRLRPIIEIFNDNKEIKKNLIRAYITALNVLNRSNKDEIKVRLEKTNTKLSEKTETALKNLIENETDANIQAVEDAIKPFRFSLPKLPWKKHKDKHARS